VGIFLKHLLVFGKLEIHLCLLHSLNVCA